jgi:hypothetical protein
MADNQFINFNSQDVADMYRRNQYARMLQDQANAPIERASYKGIEAPLHPVQGVAKMAAALLAGYQQNQMDKSYASEKAAAEQKMAAERERSNQAYEDFQAGIAPKPGFGASGSVEDYGGQEMMPKPRSDAERLAHLMSSMGSPEERVRSSAKNYLDYDAAQAQEKTRLDERAQNRLDKEAEIKRTQGNADRAYNLQLESLKQGRLPTEAALEKAAEKKQGATNAATTIKQLAEDYVSLNKIGGMRNLNQNVIGRAAASIENTAPYALQSKDASRLRERIEANIESLVGPLMRASGMTTQMLNSNVERAAFMRTLGGPGTSFESNISILKRMNDTLNFNPNKKSERNADIDKYAPERE